MLQSDAARSRKKTRTKRTSLLCGRLFDETGDRLSPSHSKTKAGARLRYYISHRLVAQSGKPHYDAWRLPAEDLERKVANLIRSILTEPGGAAKFVPGASRADVTTLEDIFGVVQCLPCFIGSSREQNNFRPAK